MSWELFSDAFHFDVIPAPITGVSPLLHAGIDTVGAGIYLHAHLEGRISGCHYQFGVRLSY